MGMCDLGVVWFSLNISLRDKHSVRSGGGIGDILEPDAAEEPRGWRTAFEMSFFLLVVVFLLNAIFGIIFDTFGHLRDGKYTLMSYARRKKRELIDLFRALCCAA